MRSTTYGCAHPRRIHSGLLSGPRGVFDTRGVEHHGGAGSRTTSRNPEVQPLPVPCTPPSLGPVADRSSCRSAPTRCHQRAEYDVGGALEVQGAHGAAPRCSWRGGGEPSDPTLTWRGLPTSQTGRPRRVDPTEFLDNLRYEIGAKEVYVFTPKGKVIGLPARRDTGRLRVCGAHRDRPPHNGAPRLMAGSCRWRTVLNSGDSVEVVSPPRTRNAAPSQDWLTFVTSTRARSKIRHGLRRSATTRPSSRGKDAISPGHAQARTCPCSDS